MNNIYELYITPEEYEKAEKNGIDKNTLYKRIREYGWDKQRALSQPKRVRPNLSKWKAIAVKNGISEGTFYSRVCNMKWDLERAATTPIIEHTGPKSKFSDEIVEEYKRNGISADTFRRRVREGWSIEDACTVKTMTKSEVTKLMRSKRQHIFSVWRKAKFYID